MTNHESKVLLYRADEEKNKGNYDEAARLASEVLAKNPAQTLQKREGIQGSSSANSFPFPSGEGRDVVLLLAHAHRILGECSRQHGNYQLAVKHYKSAEAAAEAADDKTAIAATMNGFGTVYIHLSSYDKALEYLEKALVTHEYLGDKRMIGGTTVNIGVVYKLLGSHEKALEYFEKAVVTLDEIGEVCFKANATVNIANVYRNLGSYDKALEYHEKALTAYEELGDKSGVASVTGNIGGVYYSLGSYDKALEYREKALAVHEELGEKSGVARVTGNIGNVYYSLGSYDKALEYYEKSLVSHEELEEKSDVANATGNIGNVYYSLGSYDKALEYCKKALAAFEELGEKSGVAKTTGNIGNVYLSLSSYDKALDYFSKALVIAEELGEKYGIAILTRNIGCIYAAKKFIGYNTANAEKFLIQALILSEKIKAKEQLVECHKTLAALYENEERWKEAHEHRKKYQELKEEVESAEARKAAELMEMRRVIAEKEREREFLKQQMELEMKLTREELSNKALQLVQQTEMIQNFREELDGIVHHADTAEKALRSIREKVKELPENVMNWNRFEEDFKNVHPQFQNKLKERYPQLTTTEIKICCLLRLGMKSHEIGTLLFLSERTVENHRYNLRKKLNVTESQTLYDILEKV